MSTTRAQKILKDAGFVKPQWVFDEDMESAPPGSLHQNHWHKIARTRTLCGLRIKDNWTRCIGRSNYRGPALERRCPKCQAKWEEKVGLVAGREVGMK